MKTKFLLLGALIAVLFVIAACAPAASPTSAPPTAATQPTTAPAAATSAPAATTAPAAATSAPAATTASGSSSGTFVGDKTVAPDCNYGSATLPAEFKSIEAVDEHTVKISLCHPDPDFPAKIAFAAFGILPKAYLNATGGDTAKIGDTPVGTGPYTIKEWVHGDHITLEANPNYWGGAPKNKTVVLKWSTEAAQRLLELQSGQADGIDNVAPEDIDTVNKDTTLKLYNREPLTTVHLGMNNSIKPFDNEKVRQAIAMGIDRQRITDQFFPPGSVVGNEFIPPDIKPGADDLKAVPYDPEGAKKLLAEAGFPNGFDTQISYRDVVRAYLPSPGKVAQELQAELKNIGINATINVMESGAFLDAAQEGKLPMFLLGWSADFAGATNFYDTHFGGGSKQFGAPYPDIVSEIQAAGALSDPAQRQAHYSKINELLKEHSPVVTLAHGTSATAYSAKVDGAQASPLTAEEFASMSNGTDQIVFVQGAEPLSAWCGDEQDGETFRLCVQLFDPLLNFKTNGTDVVPGLAEKFTANSDATEYTFDIRQGAKFSDGTVANANDVVATLSAIWDAKNPNHKGRTGDWVYMGTYFGACLNSQPDKCQP